jgi:hypothetical protein
MARTGDLIDEIADPVLCERIANESKDLKETKRFGLVLEEGSSHRAPWEPRPSGVDTT